MKERPILFNGPMVRALLDGSKTQTRRIVKPQPPTGTTEVMTYHHPDPRDHFYPYSAAATELIAGWCQPCPYGQPGDRLWVRETHRPIFGQTCGLIGIDYQADPKEKWERMRDSMGSSKWTPSIHMKREYSRITLEIVSVRVERLQDISEADAIAEGATPSIVGQSLDHLRYRAGYQTLWEAINGAGSWDANPWVWVVEFKKVAA